VNKRNNKYKRNKTDARQSDIRFRRIGFIFCGRQQIALRPVWSGIKAEGGYGS
jgi:hypothetical protein